MFEDKLSQDLKTAMLAGDKPLVTVLRGLKSAILYAKIANKTVREAALPDKDLMDLLQCEAKKRQESADLYRQGGSNEKAEAELYEKSIIEKYLPKQLTDAELQKIVDAVVRDMTNATPAALGEVIAKVRFVTAGAADGATIARIVRERLSQ